MSLRLAVIAAATNPIVPKGRNSISRFAAVLTDGRQKFIGLNSYRTHPFQAKFGTNEQSVSVHAEIDAIIKAVQGLKINRRLLYMPDVSLFEGWSLFVARLRKDGSTGNACPCEGCSGALIAFGITNVEWTK